MISLRRLLLILISLFVLAALVVYATVYISSRRDRPHGESGARAEALRSSIERAAGVAQFQKLAAIEFRFGPADRRHLRDLRRRLVQVQWTEAEGRQLRVQYAEQSLLGRAWENGAELDDEQQRNEAILKAYRFHTNDFFWLNPWAQMRADGLRCEYVGERALALHYESGGVTPGDSYLIIVDGDGLPRRWQMWVQVMPTPGAEFRIEGWQEFGGVRFATRHVGAARSVTLDQLVVHTAFPPAGRVDPFAGFLWSGGRKRP